MRKLIYGVLALALVATGCAITDYPIISDDRADFSGTIRTGHKAYIIPSGQVGTIWDDGTDELFTLVYQNAYGDQKLYTFNNFDPTGAVIWMDQTYCDWRYEGCEITRAWNPHNAVIDDTFDYELFPDCSGYRSLSLLVSYVSRLGECGDKIFAADKQDMAAEFANLATTTWRGGTAYVVPMTADNTSITLNNTSLPIYGQLTSFVTEKLRLVVPMTPNTRYELSWLGAFAANNKVANLTFQYNSLEASFRIGLVPEGFNYNVNRY